MGSPEQGAGRKGHVVWRNRDREEARISPCRWELRRGTAVGGGGGGNKRCGFRLDFRKNLPLSSSGQAGEPPPPGVKDVLKRSRQMFVCVNSSVPRAREQVRRLLGLQSSFPVIWVHTLACQRLRSPLRPPHRKHALWIWNKSSNTYCFCCTLSSISGLVGRCKTASGYEKDYTNEAVVGL